MKTKLRTALAIVLAALTFATAGAYDFMADGLCYNFNDDSVSVSVTFEKVHAQYTSPAYDNLSGSIVIPSQVSHEGTDYQVTAIGYEAFHACSGITSVKIPSSILSIGDRAFLRCTGLTEIIIGPSVATIGKGAISYCTSLTSITIPVSVSTIEATAFFASTALNAVYISDLAAWCRISFGSENSNPLFYAHKLYLNDNLIQDLVIPDSATAIGESAFTGCTSITSVTIPNSVTSIGRGAFSGCSAMKSVKIPEAVTIINTKTFYNCSSLTEVTLPANLEVVGGNAFQGCTSLRSIIIPDSVRTIVGYAFNGCSALKSVVIGKSVSGIGGNVFHNCRNLQLICCKANQPPRLELEYSQTDITTFDEAHYMACSLFVPKGTAETYMSDEYWKRFQYIAERDFDNPGLMVPDVNGDGKVDIDDLNIVISYILNQ